MESRIKRLRTQSKVLSPILQIGKNGLNDTNIDEIKKELQLRELIKIKMHQSALPENATKIDRQEVAAKIASETGALLVDQIGFVIVLYKQRQKG